jgi:hypothetical protein
MRDTVGCDMRAADIHVDSKASVRPGDTGVPGKIDCASGRLEVGMSGVS